MSIFCCGGRRSPVEHHKESQDYLKPALVGAVGGTALATYAVLGFYVVKEASELHKHISNEDALALESGERLAGVSIGVKLGVTLSVEVVKKVAQAIFPIAGGAAACGAMIGCLWQRCSRREKQN